MQISESHTQKCVITGRPAHAEVCMGQVVAWQGSRHDGKLFVVVDQGLEEGAYCDEEVDKLVDKGSIVEFGNSVEGLLPASEIGHKAATELFLLGASYMADAVERKDSLTSEVNQLARAHLGHGGADQGADFVALGRLWALTEFAKGLKPFVDFDAHEIANVVYQDVLQSESPRGHLSSARLGNPDNPVELRRLH